VRDARHPDYFSQERTAAPHTDVAARSDSHTSAGAFSDAQNRTTLATLGSVLFHFVHQSKRFHNQTLRASLDATFGRGDATLVGESTPVSPHRLKKRSLPRTRRLGGSIGATNNRRSVDDTATFKEYLCSQDITFDDEFAGLCVLREELDEVG
jgi:hypothetical protein